MKDNNSKDSASRKRVAKQKPSMHYSMAEVRKLVESSDASSVGTVVQLVVEIGIRRNELVALKWEQVDTVARTIVIPCGKIASERTMAISAQLASLLEARRKQNPSAEFVFGDLRPQNIIQSIMMLCRKAGIPFRGFHTFRHM